MGKLHAKLSASGSARWLNCPGSVAAESGIVDKSSSFAQEGTAAHELADLCLQSKGNADEYLGKIIEGVEVCADMVEHVQGYVDYVRSFKGELFCETQVDFSPWVPDGFGTSDAIVICDKVVHVIDLKYGQGVVVSAENNSQAMLYALGVYNDYGYLLTGQEVFKLHIYQPRANNFSVWAIKLADLLKWGDWVSIQADIALSSDAERVPGDKQCMFCKAKATCPALKSYAEKLIMAEFDDLDDLPDPNSLSKSQMAQILMGRKLVESWFNAIESFGFDALSNGDPFPGFKLVEGRSNRKWRDEASARSVLLASGKSEDEIFTKKLISPPQAEKLLGKKNIDVIADEIVKPDGKPTMVLESDPRMSIGDVSDCFENIA